MIWPGRSPATSAGEPGMTSVIDHAAAGHRLEDVLRHLRRWARRSGNRPGCPARGTGGSVAITSPRTVNLPRTTVFSRVSPPRRTPSRTRSPGAKVLIAVTSESESLTGHAADRDDQVVQDEARLAGRGALLDALRVGSSGPRAVAIPRKPYSTSLPWRSASMTPTAECSRRGSRSRPGRRSPRRWRRRSSGRRARPSG